MKLESLYLTKSLRHKLCLKNNCICLGWQNQKWWWSS